MATSKPLCKLGQICLQEVLLKSGFRLILPPSLVPLHKVSQVEIEAGDSEGRLPQLFFALGFGLSPSSRVFFVCYRRTAEHARISESGPKSLNIGITVYPTYGGSGIVGSELGKELAARGHTVHFIASSLPTRLTELN